GELATRRHAEMALRLLCGSRSLPLLLPVVFGQRLEHPLLAAVRRYVYAKAADVFVDFLTGGVVEAKTREIDGPAAANNHQHGFLGLGGETASPLIVEFRVKSPPPLDEKCPYPFDAPSEKLFCRRGRELGGDRVCGWISAFRSGDDAGRIWPSRR